jgi:hypothetical protein
MSTVARCSVALAVSLLLAACGSDDAAAPPETPTGLSGSVAVGVAISQGKLRVLDSTGAVIASDITIAADGTYTIPTLTGTAPWRIEACGYAGANYECIYSVAQAAGTANVTPLTNAAVLLAANEQPGMLMTGTVTGLDAASMNAAQLQLRAGLGAVMNGNVPSGFDFITGDLDAGSRTGYDRVLDAIGVSTGEDGQAFVQITPRLGSGNLYLQTGTTSGSVTPDSAAGALPLSQIDALFARMTAKLASQTACAGPTGLASQMTTDARINGDEGFVTGAQNVADMFCGFFAEAGAWGATLMNPTLGRCVTTGTAPRCKVGFDVRLPDGTVMPFGSGVGVQLESGTWKFMGSVDPVSVHADARVQRQTRIDNTAIPASYMRAISLDVSRVTGLACAKVAQPVTGGGMQTFAILKAYDANAHRLSIWRSTQQGTDVSLDPATGFLRNSDDGWYTLPDGAPGDEVVRNFFRNGRSIVVSLFQDAACTTPLVVEGVSSIEVEIEGVPPVYASLPSFPWPELTASTITAVNAVSLGANSSTSLVVAWTYPNGRSGVNGLTFCGSLAQCGEQDAGRYGEREVSPSVMSVEMGLHSTSLALGASRTIALYGTGPGGIGMQSNFTGCGGTEYCQ